MINIFKKGFASTKEVLLRTPLFRYNQEVLKGKMVPFAGYEMPVQYPDGILKEHLYCRESGGYFDVSHMGQIKIRGKDRVAFLETLVVGDIQGLKENASTLSLILNEKAGILDDTIVTKFEDHIHMVVNAGNKFTDLEHMKNLKETLFPKSDISFEYLDTRALIAIQGPKAASLLQTLVTEDISKVPFMNHVHVKVPKLNTVILASRSGYTGEDGFEVSVEGSKSEALSDLILADGTIKACGLGSRDSLRLEAGLCLHGNDIDPTRSPAEAALMWTVRKNPERKYLGFDALEAQQKQGVKEKRVGFVTDGSSVARHGAEIFSEDGKKVGIVTSGTFSPVLKYGIGMAYLSSKSSKIGTALKAKVRGKDVNIKVTKMPFVPSRYFKL